MQLAGAQQMQLKRGTEKSSRELMADRWSVSINVRAVAPEHVEELS